MTERGDMDTKDFDARNEEKSRSVCERIHAEHAGRELTERERQILDMWPRFEGGEPVMPGDKVHYASAYNDETEIEVESITAMEGHFVLCDDECRSNQYEQGQRVKRPAPKVLDADGVEIHVGDTVYELETGEEYKVERVFNGTTDPDFPDHAIRCNKVADPITHVFKPDQLTHTRRDSWERLEEDTESIRQIIACNFGDFSPSDFKQSGDSLQDRVNDIIRRAKALAGVEQ